MPDDLTAWSASKLFDRVVDDRDRLWWKDLDTSTLEARRISWISFDQEKRKKPRKATRETLKKTWLHTDPRSGVVPTHLVQLDWKD